MRNFFISIVFLLSILLSTEVSGVIEGQWTLENSPYEVTGDITISPYTSLTIDPGVEVIFMGPYEMEVNGEIHADGTEELPIIFSGYNGDLWLGLDLHYSTSLSSFSWCNFSDTGQNFLSFYYSYDTTIDHCTFDSYSNVAIHSEDNYSVLTISNSSFTTSNNVKSIEAANTFLVIDNTVIDGGSRAVEMHAGSLEIDGLNVSNAEIGVHISDASGYEKSIKNSVFTNCSSSGIYVGDNCNLNVHNCEFTNNYNGIDLYNGSNLEVIDSDFLSNDQNHINIYAQYASYLVDSCSFIGGDYGIKHHQGSGAYDRIIRNCEFQGMSDYAIHFQYSSAGQKVINCSIHDNGSGIYNPRTVTNSLIYGNNYYGIHDGDNYAQINNCTIVNNQYGVYRGTIENSIIYFNSDYQSYDSSVSYSNVQGGAEGEGNIDQNPSFQDFITLELHESSPCIDSGSPSPASYDLCFPPSQGTALNDMGAFGGPGACGWLENSNGAISPLSTYLDFGYLISGYHDTLSLSFDVSNLEIEKIYQFTIESNDSENYFSSSISEMTIYPSTSDQSVDIIYHPTSSGSHSATLYIQEVSDNPQEFEIQLLGTGVGGTEVTGVVEGQWTLDNSPYLVSGDITISPYTSLTIDPGVEVIFMGPYEMEVNGEIHADGTEELPIIFSGYNGDLWLGLDLHYSTSLSSFSWCNFSDTGQNFLSFYYSYDTTIDHCTFDSYSNVAIHSEDNYSVLTISNSSFTTSNNVKSIEAANTFLVIDNTVIDGGSRAVEMHAGSLEIDGLNVSNAEIGVHISDASGYEKSIKNSVFTNCSSSGIYVGDNCNLNVHNCEFTNNYNGIDLYNGSNLEVIDSDFLSNDQNHINIYAQYASYLVDSCSFIGGDYGIKHHQGSGAYDRIIRNCEFQGMSDYAIHFQYSSAGQKVINCSIHDNGSGIYNPRTVTNSLIYGNNYYGIHDGDNYAQINNCTIVNNQYGVYRGTIENSIIYFNSDYQSYDSSVSYSNVQGGAEGEGNIDQNPSFQDFITLELHESSPCIDSGSPSPASYDLCFPPSQGTALNDMGAFGGPGACGWLDTDSDIETAIILTYPSIEANPGDTLSYPIAITFPDSISVSSFSAEVECSYGEVQVSDVQMGQMFDNLNWSTSFNGDNCPMLLWAASDQSISGSGEFLNLDLIIPEDVDTGLVQISIPSIQFDEVNFNIDQLEGGIYIEEEEVPPPLIPNYGDVSLNGSITAFDASLILDNIIGEEEFSDQQILNGDVSGDSTLSAYDASLILQYGVELIDVFPADSGSFSEYAQGDIMLPNGIAKPGDIIEIPFNLTNGQNILSFEMEVDYDSEVFEFQSITWSDNIGEFIKVYNTENGMLRLAGAGSLPDGQEGVFLSIQLLALDGMDEDGAYIHLNNLRWNEEPYSTDPITTFIEFDPSIIYNSVYQSGLSLVSFPIQSEDSSLDNIFGNLIGNMTSIISEGQASTYNQFLGWVGNLQNISHLDGYWISLSNSDEIFIDGLPLGDSVVYDLNYGANLISYPFLYNSYLSSALPENSHEFLEGVIGQGVASTYVEGLGWIGSLEAFQEGGGYWFKSNTEIEFSYLNQEDFTNRVHTNSQKLSHEDFAFHQTTKQGFYFIKDIYSELVDISEGDWIVAYNNNVVVGSRQWSGRYTDIPAMGADSNPNSIGYLSNGQIPSFKLITSDGKEFVLEGNVSSWSDLGIQVLDLYVVEELKPNQFTLEPSYPNPFNPSTTISYMISESTNLNLSIYNMKGQLIEILHDGILEPGYYEKVWNASEFSSGIYIIKMSTDTGFISSQKIILVK